MKIKTKLYNWLRKNAIKYFGIVEITKNEAMVFNDIVCNAEIKIESKTNIEDLGDGFISIGFNSDKCTVKLPETKLILKGECSWDFINLQHKMEVISE